MAEQITRVTDLIEILGVNGSEFGDKYCSDEVTLGVRGLRKKLIEELDRHKELTGRTVAVHENVINEYLGRAAKEERFLHGFL